MQCWPKNSQENLAPLPTCHSFHLILQSKRFAQKLFPPKWGLLNARHKKSKRRGDERKGKEKTGLSHFLHTDKVRKCPAVVWEEEGWMTDALPLQFYQLQLIRHRQVLFLPESPLGNGGGGGGKSSTGSSISGRAGPSSPVKNNLTVMMIMLMMMIMMMTMSVIYSWGEKSPIPV